MFANPLPSMTKIQHRVLQVTQNLTTVDMDNIDTFIKSLTDEGD
jgi:hypothetical protein